MRRAAKCTGRAPWRGTQSQTPLDPPGESVPWLPRAACASLCCAAAVATIRSMRGHDSAVTAAAAAAAAVPEAHRLCRQRHVFRLLEHGAHNPRQQPAAKRNAAAHGAPPGRGVALRRGTSELHSTQQTAFRQWRHTGSDSTTVPSMSLRSEVLTLYRRMLRTARTHAPPDWREKTVQDVRSAFRSNRDVRDEQQCVRWMNAA